jgi:hypothetical protein
MQFKYLQMNIRKSEIGGLLSNYPEGVQGVQGVQYLWKACRLSSTRHH